MAYIVVGVVSPTGTVFALQKIRMHSYSVHKAGVGFLLLTTG